MKRLKNIWLLALISALAGLWGCVKEPVSDIDQAKVNLSISTRAIIGTNINGVTISKMRIIVAKTYGNIVFNRTAENGLIEDIDDSFILQLVAGTYDIFVIANESEAMTPTLNAATTKMALDAITLITPRTENTLVLLGNCNFTLVSNSTDQTQAEVTVNNGAAAWSNQKLTVDLIRLASKITLKVTKNTTPSDDQFSITKVELLNLPRHSYMTSQNTYSSTLHNETPFPSTSTPVGFVNNGETKDVFADYIVPEYCLSTPTSEANATHLSITASYNTAGGLSGEVLYNVPLLGFDAANYSLIRNRHYVVTVTITKRGEFDYTPYIEYEVSKWENGGSSNIEFDDQAVTFSGNWATGTVLEDNGNTARVANNTSVSYEFTLSHPAGAMWTAQLSNALDFDFDLTGGGVREGVTRTGVVNVIKIKPRRAVSSNNVTSELYITVSNGTKSVELDLNNSGSTGSGNRYVIKQIPN